MPRPSLAAFRTVRLAGLVLAVALLAACNRAPPPTPGGDRPTQAVLLLAERLRANDAAGYATVAVPPTLHARLETAWRTGRSRWPLDEVPLDDRLPAMLAALSRPNAAVELQHVFEKQFANNAEELHSAATSLGLFGVEYIRKKGDYSAAERDHYSQAVQGVSRWASTAPLADRKRARGAIALLTTAARRTGIDNDDDFAGLGMQESLERLGPFLGTAKQVFATYGLDLDVTLDALDARLVSQTGDTATVRVQYLLGKQPIDTVLTLQRVDGRWYLEDYLRNAEASLEGPDRAAARAVPASNRRGPAR
jgi:hypothetical protein